MNTPQATGTLLGQADAVTAFDTALESGRMHHGWLLTGPRGTGKATFAWLAAHALLTASPRIAMDAEDAVRRRITEGNETRITLIARRLNEKTGKLRTAIDVEQVRDLRAALSLAAGRGEWRCVIVDPAEEMNPSAANALLKLLEEPPARVAFFLVSHAPGRLLPTIRSRCRALAFRPLEDDALAAAYEAATGAPLSPPFSPPRAVRWARPSRWPPKTGKRSRRTWPACSPPSPPASIVRPCTALPTASLRRTGTKAFPRPSASSPTSPRAMRPTARATPAPIAKPAHAGPRPP